MTKNTQRALTGGLLFLWCLFVFLVGPPRGDFANYWTAASLWREGADLANLYDYRWFTAQSARLGFGDQLVGFAVLTPPSALFAVPLLFAGPESGAWIWWVVQGVLGLGLGGLIARSCQRPLWMGIVGLFLFSPPLRGHFSQGQFHLVAVVALAVGFVCWRENRPVGCGVAWGVAIGMKVFAWPLLLLALCARQWRLSASILGTLFLGGLVSVALLGPEVHRVWWREVVPAATTGWFGDPWHLGYQSLGHALRVAFVEQPGGHRAFYHLPVLAAGLSRCVTVVVVLGTVLGGLRWKKLRQAQQHCLLAAASLCGLSAGSVLSQYHLIWLLPPVALALNAFVAEKQWRSVALAVGLSLSIVWWPTVTDAPLQWGPLWFFAAVPRFWMVLLLWVTLLPWRQARVWVLLSAVFGGLLGMRASVAPVEVGVHALSVENAPLISADLMRAADGSICWSGLRGDRDGLPGQGWMGFCLGLGESDATVVAWDENAHTWSPVSDGAGGVRWSTQPEVIAAQTQAGPEGGVLFSKSINGQEDLFWVGPLGSQRQLTQHPAMDVQPVWDPVRQRIWFLSDRHAGVRAFRVWWIPWSPPGVGGEF